MSMQGTQLEYYLVSLESTIGFVESLTVADLVGLTETDFEEAKQKTLAGEVKRWEPQEDEWVRQEIFFSLLFSKCMKVVMQSVRPLFLICPIAYDCPGLVDHLRMSSKERLVLNCSDEVVTALPEIAIGCKSAAMQLVVVGLRPVDWMRAVVVEPGQTFASVEIMIKK
jgi:hypothetical protein